MNSHAMPSTVPIASAINTRLPGAYYFDCYTIAVPDTSLTALGQFLAAVAKTPWWVNHLMALRNRVVRLVGLKDIGALGGFNHSKPASAYLVGDPVGIFRLLSSANDEALLGISDKHLDVHLSVFRHPLDSNGVRRISVTTVVHVHNLLGRLYMLPVAPLHRLVAPAVLNRILIEPNAA
jgi:hypothetical protein